MTARRGRGWAVGLLGLAVALVAGLVIWRVAAPPSTSGTATAGVAGSGVRPVPPSTSESPTDQQSDTTDPTPDSGTADPTSDSGTPDPTPDTGTADSTPDSGTADPTPGSSTSDGPATRGSGSLRVGASALPDDIDPARYGYYAEVWNQVFDTLTTYSGSGTEVKPDLATAWEHNAKATEWTFRIVEGRTFHDGSPVTAEAVCANFDYWKDENDKERGSLLDYDYYFGSSEQAAHHACRVSGNNVTLALTRPMAALPHVLTLSSFSIHSPDSLGTDKAVGSGPFKVVKFVQSQEIELTATADGGAQVADLTFQTIPDPAALEQAVKAGEVNLAYNQRVSPDTGAEVEPAPADLMVDLNLFGGRKALADDDVRAAVVQAIDREALVQQAGASPAPTVLPGVFDVERADFAPYDPEAAKKALAGKKISLVVAVREFGGNATAERAMVQALTEQLGAVGVAVKPKKFPDFTAYFNAITKGEVDLSFGQFLYYSGDVGDSLGTFRPGGPFGKVLSEDAAAQLSAEIDKALAEPDLDKRQQASVAVRTDLLRRNAVIPLYSSGTKWLVGDGVQGLQVQPFGKVALEAVSVP